MSAAIPIPPAPGHSTVVLGSYGRVVFTPPETLPPRTLAVAGAFVAEPLGDGRAILRDERGESWGIFATEELAEQTAERLSR